ncbi:histamine N-methyltransferase-like [Saccoglossus kowalevskii]|uniref:Histamine N-methyltransferase-like n=1 Tax=Saccoglossus kowalevskii TaxID=10224 RepID=A0ABM0LVV9_SACKO|nr:PREDICTED: histamine N-methyltransferase-like [Saccoglossus kowalevskii]
MSSSGVRSLFNDVDHYSDCRRSFLPRTKWYTERMPRWCRDVFPTVVKDITLGTGKAKNESHRALRVLGIGSGSGEVDQMMLHRLQSMFSAIECTVVEPSSRAIRSYRDSIEEGATRLKPTSFDWHEKTFAEFVNNLKCCPDQQYSRFHFIQVVETIYYLSYNGAIHEMYNLLAPGGILLIIVTAEDCGYHNLWKQHKDILQDDRMNFVTSADVKEELSEEHPFTSIRDESRVDISEVFVDDSEVGDHILDFLTHICHFRRSVDEQIREDLINLLKSEKCSDKVDGRVMFNNSFDAIIVYKHE